MNKLSILMPTFNDAEYVSKSIKSILNQSYENWELIVVNDGSTDQTESIIKSFNDPRIKYHSQENKGQLDAVLAASNFIEGDIILLFHSDDELANEEVFATIVETFKKHPNADGLYADYITIDKDSNMTGTMKRPDEINKSELIRKVFFHKGDNLIGDTFIVKRPIFDEFIIPNYLYDNTIYYVNYKNFDVLNLLKIEPWYKYRVFGENYIHSEVGKFEVSNGTFRTVYKLLSNNFTTGPLAVLTNLTLFKVFRKLKLYRYSKVEKGTSIDQQLAHKLYTLWKQELIAKGYPGISLKQVNKILHSIESIGKKSNPLLLTEDELDSIPYLFYGKDSRKFYNAYTTQSLNEVFTKILESDYDHIVVDSEKGKEIVRKVLLFYSLFYDIKVELRPNV